MYQNRKVWKSGSFVMAMMACGSRLGFPLLLLFALVLGGALTAQAATVILDGVKADRWRILVGEDAKKIDARVREDPEHAYDADFFERFARDAGWRINRQ